LQNPAKILQKLYRCLWEPSLGIQETSANSLIFSTEGVFSVGKPYRSQRKLPHHLLTDSTFGSPTDAIGSFYITSKPTVPLEAQQKS